MLFTYYLCVGCTQVNCYHLICVCVTANLCNGIIFKILGPCEGKNTLSLVRESKDLQENSSMAEILQSKVKKNR